MRNKKQIHCRKSSIVLCAILSLLAYCSGRAQIATNNPLTGPITNISNGHIYYLLAASTYLEAQIQARNLGGHLAAIDDASENQWVFERFSTFGGISRHLWIGLRDIGVNDWRWENGQSSIYRNWRPGEPNSIGVERYVFMYPADNCCAPPASWNNANNDVLNVHGVVEVNPLDNLPHAATAVLICINTFVVSAIITDGGYGYTNTPTVRIIGGGGSGAQAETVVSNGVVIAINILNAGSGYTNPPVAVIAPPFIEQPFLDFDSMSFLGFSDLKVGTNYQLQIQEAGIWINVGEKFTATNSTFTYSAYGLANGRQFRLSVSPVPSQALAAAQVVNGFVVAAAINDGGSGYTTAPAVTIRGSDGTGATAIASISGGIVTNINITSAGIGYITTPAIIIEPPPVNALSPSVTCGIHLNLSRLSPYDTYQMEFSPILGGKWDSFSTPFTPSSTKHNLDINSNDYPGHSKTGFFRVKHLPGN